MTKRKTKSRAIALDFEGLREVLARFPADKQKMPVTYLAIDAIGQPGRIIFGLQMFGYTVTVIHPDDENQFLELLTGRGLSYVDLRTVEKVVKYTREFFGEDKKKKT